MTPSLLGDYIFHCEVFPNIESVLLQFDDPAFKQLSPPKKFRKINAVLLQLIQEAPNESFLFSAVVDYIDQINRKKILSETYNFAIFEFWLNHHSDISPDENYFIRAKVAGKNLPREEYQIFFPIGMNKTFLGTHFVTAHFAPDVDTMVASFWGWMDAFACRVGDGLHIWCLPGGPPDSPVTQVFRDLFGKSLFNNLARTQGMLTLSAMDVVTQKNLIKEKSGTSISSLDHGFDEKAVILIDEQGHYQGDWRGFDVEPVRQIIILFKSCLRWFETNLHNKLISLFSKKELYKDDIPVLLSSIFDSQISACEPAGEFSAKQKEDLDTLLSKVLGISRGLAGTFNDLNHAFEKEHIQDLTVFRHQLESLRQSDLFDASGQLIEDRPKIFMHLQKIFTGLNRAIHRMRDFVESLDVVMKIKSQVLGKMPHYLFLRSDVEDIRIKMSNYSYLTVVVPENEGQYYPIGVVWAKDIQKPLLGTVSFRDFGNFEEVKMASYLSVISIVDHHKSNFKTNSPPLALIGDTQSCNVLIAEAAMTLNRNYSQGGMPLESLSSQLAELSSTTPSSSSMRIAQRLLQRKMAANKKGPHFVHPQREMREYLCFLHAILDDTDLLTKVSNRDVECVAALLNELKSLSEQKEVEIINFDHIPKDNLYAKTAAKQILRQPDMYSLYRNIYVFKEKEVGDSLSACKEESCPPTLFADTKEQNECCRVGQIKIFSSNYSLFEKKKYFLQKIWLKTAQEVYANHPEIDLHLLMISTIASAEEVYKDSIGDYSHQDALWIWIPRSQRSLDHLGSFLSAFQTAPEILNNQLELELPAQESEELLEVFKRNFLPLPIKHVSGLEFAILKYKAGSINSRKSMISPYLPRLIP